MEKLVTVILPTHNRAGIIRHSLDSVYAQTHRPIELIIVDDGSTDNTKELVFEWKEQKEDRAFIVHYVFQSRSGAPAARNCGLEKATGEYIQFLDSDDYLFNGKIALQLQELEKAGAEIAVCDYSKVTADEEILATFENKGNLYLKVGKDESLSIFTPLFHRKLIDGGICWNEELTIRQDKDFMFKLVLMSRKIIYTPGNWCYYRCHGNGQISSTYNNSKNEYLKRIMSLTKFILSSRKSIPSKNMQYYVLCIMILCKKGVKTGLKRMIVRLFNHIK